MDSIFLSLLGIALKKMAQDVEYMNNSRILWIDDNPHKLLGVRRLFRALGVNITMAISSDHAYEILQTDNDFDLFIRGSFSSD